MFTFDLLSGLIEILTINVKFKKKTVFSLDTTRCGAIVFMPVR